MCKRYDTAQTADNANNQTGPGAASCHLVGVMVSFSGLLDYEQAVEPLASAHASVLYAQQFVQGWEQHRYTLAIVQFAQPSVQGWEQHHV